MSNKPNPSGISYKIEKQTKSITNQDGSQTFTEISVKIGTRLVSIPKAVKDRESRFKKFGDAIDSEFKNEVKEDTIKIEFPNSEETNEIDIIAQLKSINTSTLKLKKTEQRPINTTKQPSALQPSFNNEPAPTGNAKLAQFANSQASQDSLKVEDFFLNIKIREVNFYSGNLVEEENKENEELFKVFMDEMLGCLDFNIYPDHSRFGKVPSDEMPVLFFYNYRFLYGRGRERKDTDRFNNSVLLRLKIRLSDGAKRMIATRQEFIEQIINPFIEIIQEKIHDNAFNNCVMETEPRFNWATEDRGERRGGDRGGDRGGRGGRGGDFPRRDFAK